MIPHPGALRAGDYVRVSEPATIIVLQEGDCVVETPHPDIGRLGVAMSITERTLVKVALDGDGGNLTAFHVEDLERVSPLENAK